VNAFRASSRPAPTHCAPRARVAMSDDADVPMADAVDTADANPGAKRGRERAPEDDETARATSPSPSPSPSPSTSTAAIAQTCECVLCLELFCDPVTTPCGHTFCRRCLARALDHSDDPRCPTCRSVVLVSSAAKTPVNVTLRALVSQLFPERARARREAEEAELLAGSAETNGDALEGNIPLFVMSDVMPFDRFGLNIFEPRYRLLIRRAMESGSRRFGMKHPDSAHACEVKILRCDPQPDGRFHIIVEGRRRCEVLSERIQDGYVMARARFFENDADDAFTTSPSGDLQGSADEVRHVVETLTQRWRDKLATCTEEAMLRYRSGSSDEEISSDMTVISVHRGTCTVLDAVEKIAREHDWKPGPGVAFLLGVVVRIWRRIMDRMRRGGGTVSAIQSCEPLLFREFQLVHDKAMGLHSTASANEISWWVVAACNGTTMTRGAAKVPMDSSSPVERLAFGAAVLYGFARTIEMLLYEMSPESCGKYPGEVLFTEAQAAETNALLADEGEGYAFVCVDQNSAVTDPTKSWDLWPHTGCFCLRNEACAYHGELCVSQWGTIDGSDAFGQRFVSAINSV
jgi:Lon protease-like protein